LNTGRVRDQWHTMTRTGKSARLAELNILLNMDKPENVIMDAEPDEDAAEPERRAVGYER